METASPSPSFSAHQEDAPAYDEISMQQSLLFSHSLKDLKNMRSQLYSAAEYFEISYSNEDQKHIVMNTLKDYALKALVNTVDHLGSVSYKVNNLLNEKVGEVSGTEFRVSCIEQMLRTWQEYMDREGCSQHSLAIPAPKHHKLGETILESGRHALLKYRELDPPKESQQFRTEKRAVSPPPSSDPFAHTISLSSRPNIADSSNIGHWYPSDTWTSSQMHLHAETNSHKETDQNSKKHRGLLKALLTRRRSRNDESLYTYLDEY
ncbi:Protein ABIL3 [Cocos nucifera]|uniref:Protein ABIL3 n=1 Tax=Cocos nucifera TaxID=13894 RepID=A0A8K0MYM9_COCNU|nr:Protein ABIL3 [Cocos nucifera]